MITLCAECRRPMDGPVCTFCGSLVSITTMPDMAPPRARRPRRATRTALPVSATPPATEPALRVISLGWGVQSFTMAVMSALGDLPAVEYAIHSDTRWEKENTYTFAEQWTPWLIEHGVNVVTVHAPVSADLSDANSNNVLIPAYTLSPKGLDPAAYVDGVDYSGDMGSAIEYQDGQLRRQCTKRWKIEPIRRFLLAECRRLNIDPAPGTIEEWLGITMDEWQRAKDADVQYIQHRYPLLEARLTRQDCVNYLQRHSIPVPDKSACKFCPYQNMGAWRAQRRAGGKDWQTAVEIDNLIRDRRPPYPLYISRARLPLVEAVSLPEDSGYTQASMIEEQADDPCGPHCML